MQGGKATDIQKIPLEIVWNATFTEAPAVKVKSRNLLTLNLTK